MPVSLEQFVKYLQESGVLAGEILKEFLPPKSEPKDAEELARELVREKKLTKFQAEELWRGKGKSLVLGNYVLLDKIGAGGMGQVFKAEHRRMHRMVAIKLLPTAMTKDKAAIARFEREVTAAAKLRHTNIIAADDADQANGVHFLVMELVDGSDLSALVKKNGPFPVAQAVNYILQAAKGLEYAHAEGVVHRDIKPANLLLDKKGTVKILDMGLARIHGDVGQAELTASGAVMGTVDFMAPEQAMSTKTADAKADIYSLGCSLYYLLTGKATYDGETLMAKLIAHREQPIPDLRAICPQVPDQVEAIFKKMVAKKIEDRYPTMTAVIADLERCAGGQAVNPPSFTASDTGLTNFLKEVDVLQATVTVSRQVSSPDVGNKRTNHYKKPLLIGGGLLAVVILLASLVVKLNSKDGTLIVKVNEPHAEIQVRNSKEFEMESGGRKSATAKLAPVEDQPAVVEAVAEDKPWDSPKFKKWMKTVEAMPAEKQLEAVSQKLIELNPGFDGKMGGEASGRYTPKIENGIVTELQVFTKEVADISPVRALSGLKYLMCSGNDGGILTDLSPLQGMQLTRFFLGYNGKLTDISFLKDMPLANLDLAVTGVTDLTPLKGMALTFLRIEGTAVVDLSPLKGMNLKGLSLWDCRQISDLSPLKDMKLEELEYGHSKVSDMSVLAGMPLKRLYCDFQPERDTEILRSIKTLETINGLPVAEFWKKVEEQQKEKKQ